MPRRTLAARLVLPAVLRARVDLRGDRARFFPLLFWAGRFAINPPYGAGLHAPVRAQIKPIRNALKFRVKIVLWSGTTDGGMCITQ